MLNIFWKQDLGISIRCICGSKLTVLRQKKIKYFSHKFNYTDFFFYAFWPNYTIRVHAKRLGTKITKYKQIIQNSNF